MNIFLVDRDPIKCAQALDDVRLNKMILETGQLLCTAYRYLFMVEGKPSEFPGIYKETHKNHPCSIWARKSVLNYAWLVYLFKAMHDERLYRTRGPHTTFEKIYDYIKQPVIYLSPDLDYNTVDFDFDCSNVDAAGSLFSRYQECLLRKWEADKEKNRKPTWFKRGMPTWAERRVY